MSSRGSRPSRVSQVSIKVGDIEKAIPVKDGGKAWLLVVCVFFCQMLCAGLVQGMGVTFVELQNYFGASATQVGWIGSCLTFSACSVGIVSGALSRRFGCRPVVMCGGLLASVSMICASFATKLWHLYIAMSCTGLGCGLVLPAAISVIGFNFQRRFGVANGLQYAGVGVGIMSIPPFFQLLFELYSWHGTLLIYGSLLLNTFVCGLLMTPSRAEQFSRQKPGATYAPVSATRNGETNFPKENVKLSKVCELQKTTGDDTDDVFHSSQDLPDTSKYIPERGVSKADTPHRQKKLSSVTFDPEGCKVSSTVVDILPEKVESTVVDGQINFSCVDRLRKVIEEICNVMGVNIFWDHPNFLCFAISVMMFGFGYASCLSYFIPRAIQDVKIPELDAAFLLTILGICSLAARLSNGFIVDMGWITPLKFFCLSCFVCAVSSFCTPFTHTYVGSLICAGLFGLASGVANPMLAMVSRELVGQKVMASALGIVLLFNGIGSVFGIFLMGYVYDHFGNYNLAFYFAGCDLLLIIVLVSLGKALTKKSRARSQRSSTSSVVERKQADGGCSSSQQTPSQMGLPNKSEPYWEKEANRSVSVGRVMVFSESSV